MKIDVAETKKTFSNPTQWLIAPPNKFPNNCPITIAFANNVEA